MSHDATKRKNDHIELSESAQTSATYVDHRFNYEPLFFSHEQSKQISTQKFLGKTVQYPFWISSMTGGVERAKTINENLAKLCGKYKLGMGLGSCRTLLYSNERLEDFTVRALTDAPLYANLGIAQVEEFLSLHKENKIHDMVKKLEVDGLIIHINPLQEWLQPEGDRFKTTPFETLTQFLEKTSYPIIVKEVGHGLGPKSLAALMELPVKAVEFGAFGGTNFTLLESLRQEETSLKSPFIHVGHTALEMVEILNSLSRGDKEFIISGGIKNVLDGYELRQKLQSPSLIGMAHAFLKPAMESFESLEKYFLCLSESYMTATQLLTLKESK
jgi:isopentenyl-diphosphate Delta-isomerase